MTNSLEYSNYDFDDIVTQIQNRLALQGSWIDTYRSGTGQMLIEFHAYVLNLVMWYVERAAQESYLSTAKNRSSIINLVRLLGYTPKRAVSATGYATFSITSSHTSNIYIPAYTKLSTTAGIAYYVTEDAVIQSGSTSVTASIKQGTKSELSITSDGVVNQEYQLSFTDIEDTGVEVYVNGILWTKVDSFVLGDSTSTWYKVITQLDDTLTIVFGDNVYAKSPSSGDTILIRYIRTSGVKGNVYVAGAISSIDSTIYDADSAKYTAITVSNADVVLGGDDAESTEEIRAEAPAVFATGDRAVTRDDYIAILLNYASIASANAWGENEEGAPNYDMFNRVKICIILQGWNLPSVTFKQTLSEYLYTKAQITVKYTYVDPTIVYAVPSVELYVETGNTLSVVQSAVEDAIGDMFELGSTATLGAAKRVSDVYETVEAVTGISYSHIVLYLQKSLSTTYNSAYDYGEMVDVLPIKTSSVSIYLNSDVVATDNGSGVLISSGTSPVVSGTVDYVTGEVLLDIAPVPSASDTVAIRYEQDSDGDLVVSRDQIIQLLEVDVASIAYED